MNKIKEKLKNTKYQCSGAPKETKDLFKRLGLEAPDSDFVYIDSNFKFEVVNPSIYKVLNCPEISIAKLKEALDEAERCQKNYEVGAFVTVIKDGQKATAIVLSDLGDTLEVFGELFTGDVLCHGIHYSKALTRNATAPEISSLLKHLRILGYLTKVVDGKFDVFYIRKERQFYWAVDVNFKTGHTAAQYLDEFSEFDNYKYESRNYFKTCEEAEDALKDIVKKMQ